MPHDTRRAFLASSLTALSLEGVLRLQAASARVPSTGTAVLFVQHRPRRPPGRPITELVG